MPRYGTFRFGHIGKYGRYNLTTGQESAIGPYVRYRMRLLQQDGTQSDYITMINQRINIPSSATLDRFRIRADQNEWTYLQSVMIDYNSSNVRVRSLSPDGSASEWVTSNRANLKQV
jgi:hypothetical protein